MKQTKAVILAAGKGTRMRSRMAKVLHPICGKTLIDHVINANREAGIQEIAAVIGYQADAVSAALPKDVVSFEQTEQLGTGHAVMQALPFFEGFDGNVLILVGDAPLIRSETLEKLIEAHEAGGYAATVLTANFDDPTGYGRMVKDGDELHRCDGILAPCGLFGTDGLEVAFPLSGSLHSVVELLGIAETIHHLQFFHHGFQSCRLLGIAVPQFLEQWCVDASQAEELAIDILRFEMCAQCHVDECTAIEGLHALRSLEIELQEQQPVIVLPKSCHNLRI